jgi:hypothetical protein
MHMLNSQKALRRRAISLMKLHRQHLVDQLLQHRLLTWDELQKMELNITFMHQHITAHEAWALTQLSKREDIIPDIKVYEDLVETMDSRAAVRLGFTKGEGLLSASANNSTPADNDNKARIHKTDNLRLECST